jgi:hypothetical protein
MRRSRADLEKVADRLGHPTVPCADVVSDGEVHRPEQQVTVVLACIICEAESTHDHTHVVLRLQASHELGAMHKGLVRTEPEPHRIPADRGIHELVPTALPLSNDGNVVLGSQLGVAQPLSQARQLLSKVPILVALFQDSGHKAIHTSGVLDNLQGDGRHRYVRNPKTPSFKAQPLFRH